MNDKARRVAIGNAGQLPSALTFALQPEAREISDIYAAAMSHYRRGELSPAQRLCRAILARKPQHLRSLVLLGDMIQQQGRNKSAVKLLSQALMIDCEDVGAHDTSAIAYDALGHRDEAIQHYRQAIALGLADVSGLIKQSTAVAGALKRLADAWPRRLSLGELLGAQGAAPIAAGTLLFALLRTRVVHDLELERLLTAIRRGLLQEVATGSLAVDGEVFEFYCNLAQQCFLNEYAFALSDGERAQHRSVQARIASALATGNEVAPLDVVVTASYQPLHELPMVELLLDGGWPDGIKRLLNQQILQPRDEKSDRADIPALTSVDDPTSLEVQRQYEENPYPRWTTVPQINKTTVVNYMWEKLGIEPLAWPRSTVGVQILIAGCGTGSHPIDSAQRFPRARILAIDISRASLAYARRKTRAVGATNVEYAQADILKLGSLDRHFDVIESVGVLHHLSDPEAGWRVLLSLLRPNGLMLVGLYSAVARQILNAAHAFIAERGYRPAPDDIRVCRQELIIRGLMPPFGDFSSISGCRDLLFNVMEHRFTIPRIKAFLEGNNLKSFEQVRPFTFGNMYIFWVQKTANREVETTAPFSPPSSPPQ
jgi:ubiquinone/menaquinone biosynthesis C-methylase UbiE/tetratricopeptide (TPR) repeat protein